MMKQSAKKMMGLALVAVVSIGVTSAITGTIMNRTASSKNAEFEELFQPNPPQVNSSRAASAAASGMEFTQAAEAAVHAVVHIRATMNSKTTTVEVNDPFSDFFGDFFGRPGQGQRRQREIQTPKREGIGSGVIISSDGYIVTNNHVVDKSDELTVTLNDKREYKARLIGQDPATDLALIKVEGKNLPTLPIGDSDALKVGEWVLAVGNPLNLSSTVTAGIVSAKARNLMGMSGPGGIESFIQTDAAINQGNSGGALVDIRGNLVGINAAIISNTGSYSGYGFAIPVSIMTKVVADLKEYGVVQRAMLGIMGGDNSDELSKKENLGVIKGVYVSEVTEDGAAADAGLKKGDVITALNGKEVNSMAELQESIARLTPGAKVKLTYYREKKEHTTTVTLKNSQGNTKVVKSVDMEILGAAFRELPQETMNQLSLRYGIEVTGVQNGRMKEAGITKGFIIQKVNGQSIKSLDDMEAAFKAALQDPEQVLFISGLYPSGRRMNYAVDVSSEDTRKN